ncbi:SH3 domain-containing protein [Streptomyces silvisoli]|uniref:SH3 domain-containing protein n=1 Tax=Streptomyces silvisoli TaxID=3034235 RepID=A0ABT5ZTJ9_9ACTN|nr:SH3 domain-containing protein [Streptomyces silvisoli]MDF3293157.1 SH3 domain-containing protein [Streptomyces silvisoli]
MPTGRGHHTMLVPDAKGRVVARHSVVIRSGPSTRYQAVGHLDSGRVVRIVCKVRGQRVRGNAIWYKLDTRQREWVSASYVKNVGRLPRWCRNVTTLPSLPGHKQHLRPGHRPSRPMPGQRPQAMPSQSPSILPGNVAATPGQASPSAMPSATAQNSTVTHRARIHHD